MIIQKYLIISNRGNVVIRERENKLDGNEISLRLVLDIPNELFQRPQLVAEMKIPGNVVPKAKINMEVSDNVERVIKQVTGLTMRVSVVEHEKEKTNEERNRELMLSLGFKKRKDGVYIYKDAMAQIAVTEEMAGIMEHAAFAQSIKSKIK